MADAPHPAETTFAPLTARAVVLGERIDTAGLERRETLSTAPLSFRVGDQGMVVVFRPGVVVLMGIDPLMEDEVIRSIMPRVVEPLGETEEEALRLAPAGDREEGADPQGVVHIVDRSPARLLVVAYVIARSATLSLHERQVEEVLDTVEAWAADLASTGRRRRGGRRTVIRQIGQALLVQHRVGGRIAVGEKPDLLWDHPELERLYARLETEYELDERAEVLSRKLELIAETARVMSDLIDTERSLRLEVAVVLLIVAEVVLTLFQMAHDYWR